MQFHYSPLAVAILHCLTTTTVCARQTLNIRLILNLKKFHKKLTNSDALFKATAKIISLLMKHVRTSKSREEQQLLIANNLLPEHCQVGHVTSPATTRYKHHREIIGKRAAETKIDSK